MGEKLTLNEKLENFIAAYPGTREEALATKSGKKFQELIAKEEAKNAK